MRSQSQPLPSFAVSVQPKRARAPSDPFLDTPSASSRSALQSHTPGFATPVEGRSSPFTGFGEEILANTSIAGDLAFNGEEETDYMRIWTSPDLTNPELLELIELFPSFVTRRPLPRFPAPPARLPDLEEGEDELEGKQIHFGTGSMWVSNQERGDGWDGSWWLRFVLWWKRMFSC
jgi:hypothetical protein